MSCITPTISPLPSAELAHNFHNGQVFAQEREELDSHTTVRVWSPESQARVRWRLCLIVALLDFSAYLLLALLTEVLETAICRSYYAGIDVHPGAVVDGSCKIEAVQNELAFIIGWKDALRQMPSESAPTHGY